MVDEHQLLRDSSKAAQAQALLDNSLFNEALVTLEAQYISAWKASPLRDTDGRERAWQAVQILGNIKGHFQAILNDGKLADAQLNDLVERPRRFSSL